MTYSQCPVCGLPRSTRKHTKCSRILQSKYAPGTQLHAEQEENRIAGKTIKKPYIDIPQGKKASYYIRVGGKDKV